MALIHPTAIVHPGAELAESVEVGPYSVIGEHVRIGAGTKIMAHVYVEGRTTIGRNCAIFPFASIGTQTQDLKFSGGVTHVRIGDGTTLREYVTVNSGTNEGDVTEVGSGCHIMAYSHVAHQCRVGNGVIISNCGTLAGHVIIEDKAVLGGLCGVHQFVRIGAMAIIGGCSKVTQDIPPFMLADGNPASVRGINSVGLQRNNVPPETRRAIKEAYRILYREGLATSNALERIRAELPQLPELKHLAEFIAASERGIAK